MTVDVGELAILALLGVGLLFAGLGTLGLHRFPDFYTRLHAATKCTTFGAIFLVAAVAFYAVFFWQAEPQWGLAIHAVFGLFALLLTNPAGAHALARAAYRAGLKPQGLVVDELARDLAAKAGVAEAAHQAENSDAADIKEVTR